MKKIIILMALLTPLAVQAIEWSGKVVGISDGDTVSVLNSANKTIRVRLIEIDAPEKTQDFGERSKQSLSELCFNKMAKINDKGQDKYQRTLGRVYCDGVDANAEQVKRGMAWAYRQYLTDQSIADLEQTAKEQKLGLWSMINPTPPWEFRHGNKNSNSAQHTKETKSSLAGASNFTCGSKSRCGEMISCEEAKFYLNNCGMGKLDRDKDGIPCESICR